MSGREEVFQLGREKLCLLMRLESALEEGGGLRMSWWKSWWEGFGESLAFCLLGERL